MTVPAISCTEHDADPRGRRTEEVSRPRYLDYPRREEFMTEAENLVLEQLRAIRATLTDHTERLGRIELRLGVIEQRLSAIELRLADVETVHHRRLDRIERRLNLVDEPGP